LARAWKPFSWKIEGLSSSKLTPDRHCKLITAAGGLPAMEDVSKLPEAKKKRDGMTYQVRTLGHLFKQFDISDE
jgi:hypothetical protein